MVLAAMIGAGSVFGAIDAWYEGVLPHAAGFRVVVGHLAYTLALTIGLLLAATVPATLISAHDRARGRRD